MSGSMNSGSGSGTQSGTSTSSSAGASSSKSNPTLSPQQLIAAYNTYLPSMLSTASNSVASSPESPALTAANKGAVEGVNAINLNGLSPGEANSIQRSTNQTNFGTGNLGNSNATNTIANAMNFGGAFNSKIPLLNASTNTASQVAGAGSSALGTALSGASPLTSVASAPTSVSNSVMQSMSNSQNAGQSSDSNFGFGTSGQCFLTTACCQYKGLPDDCEELTILRQFRDKKVSKRLVAQYYRIAPGIVKKINGDTRILQYIWDVVKNCTTAIKAGDDEAALQYYTTMVNKLKTL